MWLCDLLYLCCIVFSMSSSGNSLQIQLFRNAFVFAPVNSIISSSRVSWCASSSTRWMSGVHCTIDRQPWLNVTALVSISCARDCYRRDMENSPDSQSLLQSNCLKEHSPKFGTPWVWFGLCVAPGESAIDFTPSLPRYRSAPKHNHPRKPPTTHTTLLSGWVGWWWVGALPFPR